jgi:hypothetical protein
MRFDSQPFTVATDTLDTLDLRSHHLICKRIMFYGDNVQDTRQLFFLSWHKYRQKKTLLPLEKQIADVILSHPEYHLLFDTNTPQDDQAYFPELGQSNPFLHMGLHLAIRDQVATNRPPGISSIYQRLVDKYADINTVEHLLMDHLVECLWRAQRNQQMPDETTYLNACRRLLTE